MPKTLSPSDIQDICAAMAGLVGAQAMAEAQNLAAFYGVRVVRIYEVSRRVRPQRKKRTDTGRRKHDLMGSDALKFAAELVVNQNLAPELALLVMRENAGTLGEVDINVATFRKYLREHGISRTQARLNRAPHRTFEAEFPGQIFQFDISGVKERWVDIKTRSIHKVSVLEVSKNHANRRMDRVPLWKFTVVDDKSRKKFLRFVACPKPNTVHVVDFLREAFLRLGLPVMLYTDNDSVIVNKRTLRGARFLDAAFKDSGGFELLRHLPGNPQATGKVERAHRIVEEYEKLIGVKIEFGSQPHIDALNRFADWIAARYNSRPHSVTRISPDAAFRATTNPFRMIDPAQFDAAFKARDLSCKVARDVTIMVDSVRYQLSRREADPFNFLAETGQRLEVYWLDEEEFFACVTPAGEEYIVEKIPARADLALDYRNLPETRSERTRKELQRSQKERIRNMKEDGAGCVSPHVSKGELLNVDIEIPSIQNPKSKIQNRSGSPPYEGGVAAVSADGVVLSSDPKSQIPNPKLRVPGLDTLEHPSNVTEFPRRIDEGDRALLDELTHHAAAASLPAGRKSKVQSPMSEESPALDIGPWTLDTLNPANSANSQLDLFDALDLLQREGLAPDRPGPGLARIKERLKLIFEGRETITGAELRDGLKKRRFKATG
jgi:hypothetical protein